MKSLLLGSVVVSFLVTMVCARPPQPDTLISDLAGVWVTEGSVKALHETFSPSGVTYQLAISTSKDGKTFKLYYGNVTESIGYELMGLDRTAIKGEYAFLMGRMFSPYDPDHRSEPGQPFRVRVILRFDNKGQVANITLPDNCFGFSAPKDRFVRIPVGWLQYINRVVFVGKWKNGRGEVFSFKESGQGLRPNGGVFTFKLLMAEGTRLRICLGGGSACEDYVFRRIGNELHFFRRAPFLEGGAYERKPFLVLKKDYD